LVGEQRPLPVSFERQQALCKVIGITISEEIAAILPENIGYIGLRIPPESAPDSFIHVIVAALRVSDEADRIPLEQAEDAGFVERPRIDNLASLGCRIRHIPILNRILRLPAVRYVRVMPDRISRGNSGSQLRQAHSNLRPEDDAGQPRRLLRSQEAQKLIEPGLTEALRRHTQL